MGIFTIGYQNISIHKLRRIAQSLDAVVVDVRLRPWSARPEFCRYPLRQMLGTQYVHKGDCLGGMGQVTEQGITWLGAQRRNVLLMCLEEAPGDCHRHSDICMPYFPDALHIFGKELITAAETERLIGSEADGYAVHSRLDDILNGGKK
jgi:hypothetical protein